MFRKLKRKFILTNLLTSTAVLLIAFTSIYLIAQGTSEHRTYEKFERQQYVQTEQVPTPNENNVEQPMSAEDFKAFDEQMAQRIETERKASLQTLLISLIVTGLTVEIAVALISIYLAEQSIKPVREAYLAQKEFVANASHEIKTPLAVIQANLEAADIHGNQWIDNVMKKADDLANLNNQLLALARSDSISEEKKIEETNLNHLISDAISAFQPRAAEKDIRLSQKSMLKDTDHLKLNASALEQILNIYLDNGIKYGKKRVTVIIKKDRIEVASDGKLIEDDKLKNIFARFYQTDKSSEGVGLGLAIASSIAEKNHWQVYAKTDKEKRQNIFILEFK